MTQPAKTTQASGRPKRKNAGAAGSLGFGLLLLIGGLAAHSHFGPLSAICESGLGQFAQEGNTSATASCGLDSFVAQVSSVLTVVGGVLLGLALLIGVLTVIEAGQRPGPGS